MKARKIKPKAKPRPASFDVANRLFFRLYQCSNLMHKNGTRCLSEFGSTTQQWAVLGALTRPDIATRGMTVKDLIAFLLLSRQNLNLVLERLQQRGWIGRVKDREDGRSRRIKLTAEGARVWARMQRPIGEFYKAVLVEFKPQDRVHLYRLLDRLKTGLNEV